MVNNALQSAKLSWPRKLSKADDFKRSRSHLYDLTPSEVKRRVDDALNGMDNALKANPKDVTEQYEKKIEDLHAAYGEAMLQAKFLKSSESTSGWQPE